LQPSMNDPFAKRNPPAKGMPEPLPDYEVDSDKLSPATWLGSLIADPRFHVIAALAVMLVLALLAAPPLYRKAKAWRAMSLVEKSLAARNEGDQAKAVALMRQAIYLAPGDEEVLRAVQLLNAGQGDPASFAALRDRMEKSEATPEELLVLAELAIRMGDPAIAATAISLLPPEDSVRKAAAGIRILDLRGDREKAISEARQAAAKHHGGEGDSLRLLLAELLMKSNPSDIEASAILDALAKQPSQEGLTALRFLATQYLATPDAGGPFVLETADRLSNHPRREFSDQLLSVDLRLRAEPSRSSKLLEQVAKPGPAATRLEVLSAARWLNTHKAYTLTLALIGRDRALSDNDFFLVFLDATAGLDRWKEVQTLLQKEKIPGLSESIRLLFLSRSSEKLGDLQAAEEAWRELQRILTFEKPEDVAYVAAYSERTAALSQAVRAYWVMTEKKETALQGFLGVIRCQPKGTPATELLSVYEALLGAFPNLAEARCDKAYLQLLTGSRVSEAASTADELARNNPSSLATLSVAALADLKLGNPIQADARYSGKEIAWRNAPEPWKAVRLAVLRAVGKQAEADELSAIIRKDQLRPEELALISESP